MSNKLEKLIKSCESNIKSLLEELGISGFTISSRIKSEEFTPLGKRHHDYFGVRVLLTSSSECCLVHTKLQDIYKPLKIKDYIANPWKNGYKSLHIDTLTNRGGEYPLEIQVRTYQMHEKSEKLIKKYGPYYWRDPQYVKF
ncbi:MAG: hypothetical protein WC988_04175 [Patescibacteria group bacterium]